MNEPIALFITWTTYGTWLPGDARGWRKRMQQTEPTALAAGKTSELAAGLPRTPSPKGPAASAVGSINRSNPSVCGSGGPREPRPNLERWCREQLTGDAVLLRPHDRPTVEAAIKKHCEHRGWTLKAVNARSNHVHVVVITDSDKKKVRDQLKANCTTALRRQTNPLNVAKTWTKGGDIEVLETDDDIHDACLYVLEGQDWSEPTALAAGQTSKPTAIAAGPSDTTPIAERPEASGYGPAKKPTEDMDITNAHRGEARG